ncbi:hypothetical protein [Flavobacterium sp.]|jgi:hypothetical protein|uniref:hypothetical protein n=1 Tax=Flavobacterium sp. TaxID=239 RepID=UPI00391D4D99
MKTLLPLLLLFLFISCSSDDRNDIVSTNIDYYVLESKFFEGQSMTSYEKRRYDVIDGKWFSTTYLTGSHSTFQTHFYSNGLLVTEHTNMDADYIYNGQQLIAMRYSNYGGSQQYRRFVPISATTYYVEVLTAAYDDPSTQITARFIVELDAGDNLVSISEDVNFDGIMDTPRYFTYQNGDLVTAETANGTNYTYYYTDIIDNQNDIYEKTYGKKTANLIFIQQYLDIGSSGLLYSKHVKQFDFDHNQYTVLSNHYFKKKYSEFTIGNNRSQLTTTFYFK